MLCRFKGKSVVTTKNIDKTFGKEVLFYIYSIKTPDRDLRPIKLMKT